MVRPDVGYPSKHTAKQYTILESRSVAITRVSIIGHTKRKTVLRDLSARAVIYAGLIEIVPRQRGSTAWLLHLTQCQCLLPNAFCVSVMWLNAIKVCTLASIFFRSGEICLQRLGCLVQNQCVFCRGYV